MAAATLAQIIGIAQGVRASAEPWWKQASPILAQPGLLSGSDARYEPDAGNMPLPRKTSLVQVNATQVIREFRERIGRYLDITATKDWGNVGEGGARADIVIDGQVILADVPATYLLFLDNLLGEYQADFRKIQVQSLAEDWAESDEPGIWRTEQARSPQMAKVTEFDVVVPPTEFHRAEIREVSKDVVVGWWTRVSFTSALPARQLREIQDRLSKLREAVKFAVHEANRITVPDVKVSGELLGFIFGA